MTKTDVINALTKLKGISKTKAELLYTEGFTSVEKIQKASVKDLTKVEGITEQNAKEIKKHFIQKTGKEPKAAKKQTPQKPEKKTKPVKTESKEPVPEASEKKQERPEEAVEIVDETKKGYSAKKKPELTSEQRKQLQLRSQIKQRTPRFLREEWFRYKRVPMNWRRPDGVTSKMAKHFAYRPNVVSVGFRGPRQTRGLHPSGFREVLISTVADLDKINPKTQAARISGTVGTKKRGLIAKRAGELDIRILNMKV